MSPEAVPGARATRSFLQASVLMFVCSNAAIVFQFIFQSLMKRELHAVLWASFAGISFGARYLRFTTS